MSVKVQGKKQEPKEETEEKEDDNDNDTGSSTLPMKAIAEKREDTAYKRGQRPGTKCDCCAGCLLT